ncbi:unnamed protein product [Caenorhabditis sp. 36 PRJEB53466]|nr:unnamed protein product [Caenorhabditis sp. 36 PRJEB53466]
MNLEPGEEGVYRYHRQLDNSRLSADAKNPILILRDHELATLIAREVHRMNMHIPQTYLIAAIRQKYWIPQVGTLVKQVIRRYSYSKTLPSCRTTPVAPFAHVGLDYFGPITYRTLRNKGEKAWVMLITCLLTRAVHLELVLDNSTISYLMAMSRYFARRGVPKSIVCDNAPSFKLGNEMINKDIRDRIHGSHEMTVFLATREIEIRNITPLSPWKGGVYERVVGLVKRQFYKTVNRFKLTYVELESVMIQIEGTLNNRPITSTSADERDPIALRPIDLLLPQVQISIPLQTQESQGATTEKVTREYLAGLNGVLKKLWVEWSQLYLVNLRESQGKATNSTATIPKVGQVVLVEKEFYPRHKWPLGRILKLKKEPDGEVRAVVLWSNNTTIERSVKHLIPLEVDLNEEETREQSRATDPKGKEDGSTMIEINDTCAEDPPSADAFRMILIVGIGTAVCTIGIVLNTFLLLSLRRLDICRSNLLYLFLLACLDILVELCFMLIFPSSLVWDFFKVEFLYTCWHFYIKYVSTVGQVLIAASTLLIVAASFERYVCSLKSSIQFSPKRRFLCICIVGACALFMKGSVFFELELQALPHCPPFQNLRLDLSEITRSESYKTIWMFWCRSIFNVFLPFALLLLLNSLTIANLNKLHMNGFQSVLVETRCQSLATAAAACDPPTESNPPYVYRPLIATHPSMTSSTIDSFSSSDQMPTLLRRNSEACAARRRKRDATRTLAALITIYLLTNTLNLLITIMEFINPDVLGSLGEGWTYKYLADLSSVLTISSTAFRLPVYFHCNGDIRAQIRDFARNCFIEESEKNKLKKLTMPIGSSSTESVL